MSGSEPSHESRKRKTRRAHFSGENLQHLGIQGRLSLNQFLKILTCNEIYLRAMSLGTQGVRHVADDCREAKNRAGANSEVYDFLTLVRLHNK